MMTDIFLYGWNPKLDIPSAIDGPEQRKQIAPSHVLVSMVDSTPAVDLSDLVPLLQSMGENYDELGSGLVISGEALLSLVDEHKVFDGFDEIWIFGERPIQDKPDAIRLISDRKLGPEPPGLLVDWMRNNGCIAGLGDGDGLNYATFSPVLDELWSE